MKRLFAMFFLLTVLIACNKAEDAVVKEEVQTVSIDKLFAEDFEYTESKIAVEGLCVHVCTHSGKKMFLVGDDSDNMIQIFVDGDITTFPLELEGSSVKVVGVLNEEKIDMEYVLMLEEELALEESEHSHSDGHSCEFEENMNKLTLMKEKIERSAKGYLPRYTMKATEYIEI